MKLLEIMIFKVNLYIFNESCILGGNNVVLVSVILLVKVFKQVLVLMLKFQEMVSV